MKIRATTICWKNRKVLLVAKRTTKWSLPGGKRERGETIKAAAERELFEETRLQAKTLRLVGLHANRKAAHHVFEVRFKRGSVAAPSQEIKHCRWVDPRAVKKMPTGNGTAKILRRLLKKAA